MAGRGNDTLTGGAGNDRIVFVWGDGRDQIDDFDLTRDRIDLAPGAAAVLIDAGVNTIVSYGTAGDQILTLGHALAAATGIVFI